MDAIYYLLDNLLYNNKNIEHRRPFDLGFSITATELQIWTSAWDSSWLTKSSPINGKLWKTQA